MTIHEIREFLIKNPGYLKWGVNRIAVRLDVNPDDVELALDRIKNSKGEDPKICFLDIETAPMLSYVWGLWDQNVGLDQIENEWFIITFAAKFINQNDFVGDNLINPSEIVEEDDRRLVKKLWQVLDYSDIVVGHNLDKFDIKKINARFLKYGLGPVSPYKTIDTLKVARKKFALSSNKLDYLARYFGIEGKHETNFNLWKQCLKGDRESLIRMSLYCEQDVNVLEQVYYRLLPWITTHPNMGLYNMEDKPRCPICGSLDLIQNGFHTSSVGKYQAFKCQDCGAISRERNSLLSREENKNILTLIK